MMDTICSELHHFAWQSPRYNFTFDKKITPENVIYHLFEKEGLGHGGDCIVRIGTHTGVNQLRSRFMQHFTNDKNDKSIFRENIGRFLLHRANGSYLVVWELDATSSKDKHNHSHLIMPDYQKEIERQVAWLGKLVQQAGFPHLKTFEGYLRKHISFPGGCTFETLLDMRWLTQRENLLLMGAVGTGKTHMATALGVEACRRGYAVQFFRATDLVWLLQEKFAAGMLSRFRENLKKVDIIIFG
ncbi:ATP-binding protein [Paenibacillus paridis]|uniref:ATP-binding protein n=1 Tax=Paenibacillus paridis TaxID=2583376 RepID=UPI00236787A7|nr:ATP-binding protein [Paenibacillus paridis]